MSKVEIDIRDIEGMIRKETGFYHKKIILILEDGKKIEWIRENNKIDSNMMLKKSEIALI